MFVFSFFVPVWVAVFIIAFDIYWLYRTVYISTYSILAFRKMKRYKLIDWMEACRKIADPQKFLAEIKSSKAKLKGAKKSKFEILALEDLAKDVKAVAKDKEKFLDWRDIYHVILLPTAGEDPEIIEPAIQAVADSSFPNEKFIILLATEEREDEKKRNHKINYLKKKFDGKFFDFLATVHKVAAGEMKAKASNTTYAAKYLKKSLSNGSSQLQYTTLSRNTSGLYSR